MIDDEQGKVGIAASMHPGVAVEDPSRVFYTLAGAMLNDGRSQELLTIARYILNNKPDDLPALFFVAKALQVQAESEAALEYMARLVESGQSLTNFPFDLVAEVHNLLVSAVECHGRYIGSGKLQEALQLTENMIRVSPMAKAFVESALQISRALGDKQKESVYTQRIHELNKAEHDQLQDLATRNHEAGRYDEELLNRIALFEHPYDLELHSAWRLQNIHAALGCIFSKPLDAERQQLAKRLIAAVPSPSDMITPEKSDMLGRFDKFYRLSIDVIDVDAIYGAPVSNVDCTAMLFSDAYGCPLTVEMIRQRIKDQNIQAGFFAAGSKLYFERCANAYVTSILKNCDLNSLVFVCATGAWDTAQNVARFLGIEDDRLIICTDAFEDVPGKYRVFTHADIKEDDAYPITLPINYYPSVGLLYLGDFIGELGIPMFLSGMDTVLQRGVKDLVESFYGADIVVNKSFGTHLSSTYINSLQLVYPTENAKIFASFLKKYLGMATRNIEQPFAMDQFYLFMAIHHLIANGNNSRIECFGEFDINNCMFSADNIETYREHLKKHRFINIFNMGQGDKALHGSEVMA